MTELAATMRAGRAVARASRSRRARSKASAANGCLRRADPDQIAAIPRLARVIMASQ